MRVARSRPMRAAGPATRPSRSGNRGTTTTTCNVGSGAERVGERLRGPLRPEVLVLEVDEAPRPRQGLEVRAGDAALALGRERVGRVLGRVGAQHLHRMGATGRGFGAAGRQRIGMPGLAGDRAHGAAPRVVVVERVGVLPALPEGVGDGGDRGAVELGLHVVPGRPVAVDVVEVDRLRVAEVAGVVVAAVAEVDAADERDVVVGAVAPPGDDELLVVAPTASDALVEQDLAPGAVHALRQREVLLLGEVHLRRVRPPQQAAHVDAAPGQVLEHVCELRTGTEEALVGITLPVGEVHPVVGAAASTAPRTGAGSTRRRR